MRSIPTFSSIFAGAAAVAGCSAILGNFDPATVVAPDDGSAGDTGVPPGGDGGAGNDAPVGADAADGAIPPLTCTPPEIVCGTGATAVCANRDTSPDHCGACGHSCGGGTCAQGHCGPATVYQGTTVGPIAIDPNTVFFESNEDPAFKLLACPKTGCKVAPQQVAVMPFGIHAIDVPAPGTIAFISAPQNGSGTERPAIFSCPTTGCPALPVAFINDGLNGFEGRLRSVGGTIYAHSGGSGLVWSVCASGTCATPANLFGTLTRGTHGFVAGSSQIHFIDSPTRGSTIARCTLGDTACTPVSVVPGDASLVESLVLAAGKLFWLVPGRAGFMEGKLVSCDLPGCATITPQAAALDSPTGLIVDADGAWWLTAGNKLQHCAPNGCTGGQKDVLGPLDTPHDLVADQAFVYWAEKTKISRIAK